MRYSEAQQLEQLVSRLQDIALREHIAAGPHPEYIVYLEKIKEAIDQCVREDFDRVVGLMFFLDLWKFAFQRRQASEN